MNWGGFLDWVRFLFRNDDRNDGVGSGNNTPTPPVPPPATPSPRPVPPVAPSPRPIPEPAAPPMATPRPAPEPEVPAPTPRPAPPPIVPEAPATPAPVPERPAFMPPSDTALPQEGVKLGFGRLWENHPKISRDEMQPCRRPDAVPNFDNQCAIRMGTCLSLSDLLKNYDGVQCWFGHRGQGHTLRARELAAWLRKNRATFGAVEVRKNVTYEDYVNRTGIVYCQNFWGENNQGDHVDLWDGTGKFMASGSFAWEGPAMASGGLDYLERSEEVWFWPVH